MRDRGGRERKEDKLINKTNLSFYSYSLVRYKELASFVLLSGKKRMERARERPHIELLTKPNEHLDLYFTLHAFVFLAAKEKNQIANGTTTTTYQKQ